MSAARASIAVPDVTRCTHRRTHQGVVEIPGAFRAQEPSAGGSHISGSDDNARQQAVTAHARPEAPQ